MDKEPLKGSRKRQLLSASPDITDKIPVAAPSVDQGQSLGNEADTKPRQNDHNDAIATLGNGSNEHESKRLKASNDVLTSSLHKGDTASSAPTSGDFLGRGAHKESLLAQRGLSTLS
jgi:hypothetical protein